MNYEFHVGDYVETNTGTVGFISNPIKNGFPWWIPTKLSNADISDDLYIAGVEYAIVCPYKFGKFVRIGAYDFTKKEKKKIEPISDCNKHIFANAIKSDNQLVRMVSDDILNKINELVDTVNKLID